MNCNSSRIDQFGPNTSPARGCSWHGINALPALSRTGTTVCGSFPRACRDGRSTQGSLVWDDQGEISLVGDEHRLDIVEVTAVKKTDDSATIHVSLRDLLPEPHGEFPVLKNELGFHQLPHDMEIALSVITKPAFFIADWGIQLPS